MKTPLKPNYPQRANRKGGTKTHYTASDRDYDPAIDGWNTHKLRREPHVEQLMYREDDQLADVIAAYWD